MLLKPLTDSVHLQQELIAAKLSREDAGVTNNVFICHGNSMRGTAVTSTSVRITALIFTVSLILKTLTVGSFGMVPL